MDPEEQQLIVIVDDDSGMRQALSRLLVAAGYRVHAFECAEDAAASRDVAGAACLLLDIHLPGISGTHWYASLAGGRPPVVFITAFDSAEARASAHAAGGAAYLTKPFEGRVLLKAIAKAISAPAP
jgi:FixJ family two-component response regulator